MTDIERLIGSQLSESYNNKEALTLYGLLKKVAMDKNLEILKNDDKYNVRGMDGHRILADILFTLMRMERMGLIIYHAQGEHPKKFEDIINENCNDIQSGKISGDTAHYITIHHYKYINTCSTIEHFMTHGFKTPELVEAERQTSSSMKTLNYAIATFFLTAIVELIEIIHKLLC